jgi:FkbM family methyltransferase
VTTVWIKAARRLGYDVARLEAGAYLVQRRGTGLAPQQVGQAELRTHVVSHRRTTRRRANRYQNAMATHLGHEHLRWLFRRLEIDCVLDVGANTGQFASGLRRSGYRGRIDSFEPVSTVVDQLRTAAADDPDWTVHRLAAGDADGEAEINVRPGTMSSLLPSSDFGRAWNDRLRESSTETIQVRRLDGLFDEAVAGLAAPRVFLKLDTQGFDLAAFSGLGARADDVLAMQSELSCVPIYDGMPTMTEQLTAYEAAGFALSGMFPVSRDDRSLRAIEFDAVMVRA